MQRRTVLRALGAAVPLGVAGCSGDRPEASDGGTPDEDGDGTTTAEQPARRLVVPDLDDSEYDGDTVGVTWTALSPMTEFRETDHVPDHYVAPNRLEDRRQDTYAVSGLDGSFTVFANSPGVSAHQFEVGSGDPDRTYRGFDLYEGMESWLGVKDSTLVDVTPSEKLSLGPLAATERVIDAWAGDGVALESARPDVTTLLETVEAGEFLHLDVGFPAAFEETAGPTRPAGATAGLLGISLGDGSASVRAAATYPGEPSTSAFEAGLTKRSSATRQLPFRNPSVSREGSTLTASGSHDLVRATTADGKLNLVESDYVLEVTASQFEWTFEHPDGSTETDDVTVPGDQPIGLRFESADVRHGFSLPAFGINVEVPPDGETRALIELPESGRHSFACSEYCGSGHSGHVGKLSIE